MLAIGRAVFEVTTAGVFFCIECELHEWMLCENAVRLRCRERQF